MMYVHTLYINQFLKTSKVNLCTFCGILSLIIWSTNSYALRIVLHHFGYFLGLGMIYLFTGITMFAFLFKFTDYFANLTPTNKESFQIYSCLIINNIFAGLAFGMAPQNEALLQITLINYTWVILMNIMLVYILNYKITNKQIFFVGIVLSTIGLIVSCGGTTFGNNFFFLFKKYYYCYIFSIISALLWSLYSILLKKYKTMIKNDHVVNSMILSGLFLLVLSSCFHNSISNKKMAESICWLIYEILFAFCVPFYLWNISNKYGNIKIIANFSMFAPLINVLFTSITYKINDTSNVLFGTILLTCAIICCKESINISDNSEDTSVIVYDNVVNVLLEYV